VSPTLRTSFLPITAVSAGLVCFGALASLMLDVSAWPMWALAAAMIGAAAAIALAGTKLTAFVDQLADRTGMGEAFAGGLLLGAVTSLPGITASVTAALDGRPELAISNAVGGIAAQTMFIAVADLFHRKVNLEHAAASVVNLMQSTLLVFILALVLVVMLTPEEAGPSWVPIRVGHLHVATPVILLVYLWGYYKVFRGGEEKMWLPRRTPDTREDEPEEESNRLPMWKLWAGFGATAVVVFFAGVLTARAGGAVVDRTPLTGSFVGMVFTAVATSLPELISAIAAVRRGALQLAVGDIVGGNAFDCLFICAADAAFFGGSIYHATGPAELLLVASGLAMTAVLLMGLLHRQRSGLGGVGFEAWLMLAIYLGTVAIVAGGGWPDG